ncbi:MAG: sulfite exporter TauE/SafE family protein, partial [Myxococcota bacterium]|nr:sulfite exporter TauE/SafE family protein [Myxococcota bacterium]
HARRGAVHVRAAGLFALTGVPGAVLGSGLTSRVPQQVLLGIFAALMLAAGVAMLRGRTGESAAARCRVLPCLLLGAGLGVLTGFLGGGGGFLIVPALVLLAGVEPREAVGASLAVITVNALAGLAGQLRHASFDLSVTAAFVGLALLGMRAGVAVADRLPGDGLRRAFGALVIGVGLVVAGLAVAGVTPPG